LKPGGEPGFAHVDNPRSNKPEKKASFSKKMKKPLYMCWM